MSFLNLITQRDAGQNCGTCIYFKNHPLLIEEAYQGLTTFSSGYASVRDQDGICDHKQLYLSYHDSCPDFILFKPNI